MLGFGIGITIGSLCAMGFIYLFHLNASIVPAGIGILIGLGLIFIGMVKED